eukprot:364786-Chlamydomonas_euryale.AAC.12
MARAPRGALDRRHAPYAPGRQYPGRLQRSSGRLRQRARINLHTHRPPVRGNAPRARTTPSAAPAPPTRGRAAVKSMVSVFNVVAFVVGQPRRSPGVVAARALKAASLCRSSQS